MLLLCQKVYNSLVYTIVVSLAYYTRSSVKYEPQYTHHDMTPVTLVLMLALR
jgi:hypothetical protein